LFNKDYLQHQTHVRMSNEKTTITRNKLPESSQITLETYDDFFKHAGVALWIEDGSQVKAEIEILKQKGVRDFREYLGENPGETLRLIDAIKVIDVNEYTVTLFKAYNKRQVKTGMRKFFHEDSFEHLKEELLCFIEGKLVYEYESDKRTLEGDVISTRVRTKIPQKNRGDWKIWYVTEIDVTEERKMQRRFSEQIDQYGLLDSFRNKLISVMSHDLRNPFCSILGFSELLIERFDTLEESKKLDYVKYINQTAQQTNQLLNNLLNWARMREDHLILHCSSFSFNSLMIQCESQLGPTLATKSMSVTVKNPLDINLWADYNAICFVLRNIIGNAIKFSSDNSTVDLEVTEDEENSMISITDHGVGMDDEEMEKLFRVGTVNLDYFNKQGAGVGLILCRDFVKLHGGTILVESTKHAGTTFNIKLPRS